MEMAAYFDYFGRAYGWDYWTVKRQPEWLEQRLPIIGQILAEIEKEQAAQGN